MKTHCKHHEFKITKNKFSLGSIERHKSEKGVDDKRFEIKEGFLFTGYTINLLIFEIRFGVKVYTDYIGNPERFKKP